MLTRPLKFSGKHLFVNAAANELRAEVCREDGRPIPGFTRDDCQTFTGNSTKQRLAWRGREDLASLSGQHVRLKFYLRRSQLYAFWVSRNSHGASGGATAAGGPGIRGTWDA